MRYNCSNNDTHVGSNRRFDALTLDIPMKKLKRSSLQFMFYSGLVVFRNKNSNIVSVYIKSYFFHITFDKWIGQDDRLFQLQSIQLSPLKPRISSNTFTRSIIEISFGIKYFPLALEFFSWEINGDNSEAASSTSSKKSSRIHKYREWAIPFFMRW